MNNCLIVIDLQNDYFPGGSMELVGVEEAAANARILLKEFRKKKLPVVHVRHIATRPDAGFFLPETEGAKIHHIVAPEADEIVVVKNYPNSFRNTPLLDILKEIQPDNLVICGAMSHMCIDATTRAAFDAGFNCTVAEDACATKDLIFKGTTIKASQVHASFMAALSAPYAQVRSTTEVIQCLA
jgi:nicotinamidase-related amidase